MKESIYELGLILSNGFEIADRGYARVRLRSPVIESERDRTRFDIPPQNDSDRWLEYHRQGFQRLPLDAIVWGPFRDIQARGLFSPAFRVCAVLFRDGTPGMPFEDASARGIGNGDRIIVRGPLWLNELLPAFDNRLEKAAS